MFLFSLCNPGSEKALKMEAALAMPSWRPSYQKRGFVTFKTDDESSGGGLHSPCPPTVELACARRLCVSLGKAATRDEANSLITNSTSVSTIHHARYQERKMQGLHDELISTPKDGDIVGTVVELGPDEFWAGYHRHAAFLSPDPAGDAGIEMPPQSPSRAWLKLEEAARFFGLTFSTRDIVAELGCAPGGVVLALLDRGVSVIGVDPAKMAEVVTRSAISDRENPSRDRPWFYHVRKPAALVSKRDLGNDVTWFMSDMNQTPEVVLTECARFCKMAPGIRNVLITLKLTDLTEITRKPAWFASLREIGFKKIRLQQFAVHHRELALLAMK